MKSSFRLIATIFLFTIWSVCSAQPNCHLNGDRNKGTIIKICKNEIKEIDFDYRRLVVELSEDITEKQMAILWYTPKDSKMSDERYFIFDYKNMIIYDNQCLGGNFIMLDDDKKTIVFSKYGEFDLHRFDEAEYKTCSQALEKWRKIQH